MENPEQPAISELLNSGAQELGYLSIGAMRHVVAEMTSTGPDDALFDTTGKTPAVNLSNALRIMENSTNGSGPLVWYDEFLDQLLTGQPPRRWKDIDDLELTLMIQKRIAKIGVDITHQAAKAYAARHTQNCVRDWLNTLVWDREPRISHFFDDHFGAAGTVYVRSAARNFWVSMVARIYRPGCQVDNMIVLEGSQGIGKSRALRIIGGPYFAEQHENASNIKAFAEVIQGKMLIEISELDAFTRSEVTRVKAVISNVNDCYRKSYGRHAEDHPRQCVFVGTTNKDDWNRDETGARRFWPIRCVGEIDIAAIARQRDQCFAEAVTMYKSGATWWEMPRAETAVEQTDRYQPPSWLEPIIEYIHYQHTPDGLRERIAPLTELSITEILEHALRVPTPQWNKASEMRIAECLRFMRWHKRDVWRDGRTVKRWVPKND